MTDYNDILVTKMLSGPVSLTYFNNVYGKDFYIFCDYHFENTGMCKESCDKIGNCMEITKYLDLVFKNAPHKIDFFLEIPFIEKDYIGNRDIHLLGFKKEKDIIRGD